MRALRLKKKTAPAPKQYIEPKIDPAEKRSDAPRPPKPGRSRKGGGIGRDVAIAVLSQYGLLGRVIEEKLFGPRKPKNETPADEKTTDKKRSHRSVDAIIEKMTLAPTRGLAELSRRITLMDKNIGAALNTVAASARVLTREGVTAVARPTGAGNNSAHGGGPGMLGLGLAVGVGALLASTGSAKGIPHPSNIEPNDLPKTPPSNDPPKPPAPGPEEEHRLREKDKEERGRDKIDIEAQDIEFKADTIEFKADNLSGLETSAPGSRDACRRG